MPRSTPQDILAGQLDALLRTAYRLANNHEDAEELVQETCFRLLRKRQALAKHPNPRGYIFASLYNLAKDRGRRASSAPQIVSLPNLGEEYIPAGPVKVDLPDIVANSLDEEVEAALEEMGTEYRTALLLREVEGFSYAEIAEALGIPPGTVRSRLARARSFAAARLEEYARKRGYLGESNKDSADPPRRETS